MAFRLEEDEKIGSGIKRVLTEEIDRAVGGLADPEVPKEKGIHDARRSCKRIRAVLHLIRWQLPDEFKTENRWFRDTAGKLARVRDAEAMVECFDDLAKDYSKTDLIEAYASVRDGLHSRRDKVANGENANGYAAVVKGFRQARERIAGWTFEADGLDIVEKGLRRTYRQARRDMKRAAKSRATEDLHEWRKAVKYFWHQTEVLRRHVDLFRKNYREQFHQLSSILGDDHDLALLREMIIVDPEHYGSPDVVLAFVKVIDKRRKKLQNDALKIGREVFAEKPKRYIKGVLP